MNRNHYYEALKKLARERRAAHNVKTDAFGLREIRKIYKDENIRIDYWPLPWRVKALYMCADNDCSVALQRALPDEPKLFALLHELKHHYCDQELLGTGTLVCSDDNQNEPIEIGAEVFAAEFIYPEAEWTEDIENYGAASWSSEEVVRFKKDACKAKVSYRYICKRLERAHLILPRQFVGVQFRKLEEKIYGVPIFRRKRVAS